MASEDASLLIKIKETGSAALKGVKKGLEGIKGAAGVALGALKLASAALGAIGGIAIKTAQDFGEFQGVKRSFTALAQSQGQDAKKMLDNMKQLSAGTISNVDLMKQANNAMLLGLPIDRLGDMLMIARSSAQATGQSLEKMFADLTTGLGRGSKLVIDNLGITFKLDDAYKEYAATLGKTAEKLSEAEKKQAFINKALAVGVDNAKKSGDANMTLSESMSTVTAGLKNFSVFVGEAAAPAVQFFAEVLGKFFADSDNAVNTSALQDFFQGTAKVVVVAKNLFTSFGQVVGTVIAAVSTSAAELFQGRFQAAIDAASLGFSELKLIAIDNVTKTGDELERIDELYANQKKERAIKSELDKQAALRELRIAEGEELDAAEAEKIDKETLEAERELAAVHENEIGKQRMKLQFMEQDLKAFTGHAKKKKLMQAQYDLEEQKFEIALTKFKEEENKKRLENQRSTLATIATMSNSNNRVLAAIGKAAAITQIAIETPVAIAKAMAAFPPPANFIAAGLVGVAMATQAANIAGVQLAEGGIVQARPGGIQATIGEGGRNEAVIPLPDGFDPDSGAGLGGGTTIVFNGPVLGDQEQARQFAKAIDEQLYKLRKNGDSVAFDQRIS